MTYKQIICITLALFSYGLEASAQELPTAPTPPETFSTAYAFPTGGTVHKPMDSTSFQAALDSANLGDVIELQAGTTYTGPFTLPNKTTGSGWIYIITSASTSLPAEGDRVSPSDSVNMPKIASPNNLQAIIAAPNSHHYRFVGVEILPSVGTYSYFLVDVGVGFTTNTSMPNNLVFDRCYVHSDPDGNSSRRGFYLNGEYLAVIDSYVAGFTDPTSSEPQTILVVQGDGPYKIVNNYLQSTGENIMFGGADPSIANSVPSDIEIRGNHFHKLLSWVGVKTNAKNLLEFKNAQRVLVEGNIFENSWLGGQNGDGLLITPRNQSGGCLWCVTQDITIRKNKFIGTGRGMTLSGRDTNYVSQVTTRVLVEDNIIVGDGNNNSSGHGMLITNGIKNLDIKHNTIFSVGPFIWASENPPEPNGPFRFVDNIADSGSGPSGYVGFWGDGIVGADNVLPAWFSDYTYTSNVLVRDSAANNIGTNFYPADTTAVGFTDYAGEDYSLSAGSAYKAGAANDASDGTDMGADIDALNTAIGCTLNGQCSGSADVTAPTVPPSLTATAVSSSQIDLSWSASTDAVGVVGYRVYRGGTLIATVTSGTTYSNTGLSASTLYTYTVRAYDAAGNTSSDSTGASATTNAEAAASSGGGGGGSSSGGGGGGGSSSRTTTTTTKTATTTTTTPTTPAVTGYTFTKDLFLGSENEEVRELQKYLNAQGFSPASPVTGVGAPGKESTYFGNRTEDALKRFQKAKGLTQTGRLDLATRTYINKNRTTTTTTTTNQATIESLLALVAQLQAQLNALLAQKGQTVTTTEYTFTRDLTIGMEGEDVRQLQIFLNAKGFSPASPITGVGAPGKESTYFGNRTADALKAYQKAQGIDPTGYFGPATRALLNK